MNKKEVVLFRKKVPPLSKGKIVERIKSNGTIEKLMIKFYIGQELHLKVYPYIKHCGNQIETMVTLAGEGDVWLTGDDDSFVFDIVVPVNYDDEIVVEFENISEYEYNLVCDITVDYYQGTDRVVGGVV